MEEEIALIGDSHNSKLSLFEQEHPGLEPLRAKVDGGLKKLSVLCEDVAKG